MTHTSLCSCIILQWPRDIHHQIPRILTRNHFHLHKIIARDHHSMPPKGPIGEGDEQNTPQDIQTPAEIPQRTLKDGKPKAPRSRAGRTNKQKATGPSSGSNSRLGDFSIQPTDNQQPFRNQLSQTTFAQNSRPGSNNIHSMATSTRPSYLNNQWRRHSTQQTPPVDTEGLTQALEQLTTQDNNQATGALTAGPTKSRWRTAKPVQPRTSNTASISTRTPSHTSNIKSDPHQTTQAATLPQQTRTSQRKRGMPINSLRMEACQICHTCVHHG